MSSSRSFRVFFDVLPYALRNEGLEAGIARPTTGTGRSSSTGRSGEDQTSPSERQALLGLAELMTAVVDGLAIQEAIDDGFDMRRPYAVLEFMLRRSLPGLLETELREGSLSD